MTLYVLPDGTVQAVYSDTLAPLLRAIGPGATRRASHVEPAGDGWTADMGPMGGPVLGPFNTRQQALDAEQAWIARKMET